ncbi:hypothetical protein QNI16_27715 [Cytophagaceae bacterium YF14B1]|uniref:Uncharacterized protein n=1 Tax=Xanthocytophaga flava TaxID=3048013 RepID=A0AAE3QW63_9BACT|nr:hypothetical protein [Xanthocytophaga flavus]MDJ1484316.1 hypothetical protein [Xanthocytophaga flavus]
MRKLALVALFFIISVRVKAQWTCDDIMSLVNTKWVLSTYNRMEDSVKLKSSDTQYMIAFCEKECIEFYVNGILVGTGYYKKHKKRCYDIMPSKKCREFIPDWKSRNPKMFDMYFFHFFEDLISAFIIHINGNKIELGFSNDPMDWGWLRFKRAS